MNNNYKRVGIFGSTGSIGCNSLDVIENLNKNGFPLDVIYLTTNSRIDVIASQIMKFRPRAVVIQNESSAEKFNNKYNFPGLEILTGEEGLLEIASRDDYDLMLNALVGFSGLKPTVSAIKSGKNIALANKETLVVAGKFINDLLYKNNVKLIPIDSEHSAILQCMAGENFKGIAKIILTASGGPFLNKSIDEIKATKVKDALCHPTWSMGEKITIDSATMINKGFEVIEAKWLFNIDSDNIVVLIHPQSIVHSMVEFKDGSVKAQLGIPDMKIPIQYALTYPERIESNYPRIDFNKIRSLTFEEPDTQKFKGLKIAYDVLNEGGSYSIVMNAANEVAVDLFLHEKIKFFEITDIIETQLNIHNNVTNYDLEDVLEINSQTRKDILNNYQL